MHHNEDDDDDDDDNIYDDDDDDICENINAKPNIFPALCVLLVLQIT